MNAGTCWGKNTIDPSGRGIEKPREATLTLKNLNDTSPSLQRKRFISRLIEELSLNYRHSDIGYTSLFKFVSH
jgi:ribosomal protein L17